MADRRVVVTGMGAVTPFGVSVDCLWDALIEGRSGLGPITLFDASEFTARIAGECAGYHAEDHLDRKELKRLDRYAQFALVSADEALRMSALDIEREDPCRMAVMYGSGIGGMIELETQFYRMAEKGPRQVSAFTIPKLMLNAAAGNISIRYGAKGPSHGVCSACASASNAMGEALRLIRHDEADVVFTGGSEAAITRLAMAAFASMKALSTRNDGPAIASRPFDKDRDGFVLSEGAGTLVLEEMEHARKRGAPMLAEVIGFASSSDAGHLTQPGADGEGPARAMRGAVADGGISLEDVDYINAHATATPLGDLAETAAIKTVFGEWAKKLAISSTKGAMGHTLGASGGVELIATICALNQSVIPPTLNLDHPGDGCDLDYCANTPRDGNIRVAMSNSFGFGGHNASILVRRID